MKKRLSIIACVITILVVSSVGAPQLMDLLDVRTEDQSPAYVALNPISSSYLNSLDSSGGNTGWSPVYRQFDGGMVWDSYWDGGYRHTDSIGSTSQGTGTVLEGDSDWNGGWQNVLPETAMSFYQYIKVSLSPDIGEYTLHLDFWFMEESSVLDPYINNWAIAIFGSKVSSWQDPLWEHVESGCDEHLQLTREVFDISLEDTTLYILIGHTDQDEFDRGHGHTKHFDELSIKPLTVEEVRATEDCLVSNTYPDSNFNNGSLMVADVLGMQVSTYLKFSLSGILDIQQATLKLYCEEADAISTIACNGLSDSSWFESNITWNTQPQSSLVDLGSNYPQSGSWQVWDVTSWAQAYENESSVSFVLTADDDPVQATYYSAEDATMNQDHYQYYPILEVEGEYYIEHVDTSEFIESFMEASYVLYDPPGENSYQVFKTATSSDWNMEMGIEVSTKVGVGAQVPGLVECSAGVALDIGYSHEWGWSETFSDTFSSSLNTSATGVDGDAIIGRVINMTYRVDTYRRSGDGWESYFAGSIEFVDRSIWIETAVVPRWWCNKPDAPFSVPEIPDMHRVESRYNTSYYAGPGNPVTHSVTHTYSQGDSVDFKLKYGIEQKIPLDPTGTVFMHVELEMQFNLKWTASTTTTFETEFHLEDPNGVLAYACCEDPITLFDGQLESQSYIFWFYY